jgi:hypothetical protein
MPKKLPDVLGVARPNLEQIAVVSGDVMQLENLRTLRQRVRNAVVARRLVAPDSDEGEHRLVDGVRIHERGVSLNDAASLEFPDPLKDCRGGEPDNARYVSLRYSGVFLK